MFLGLHDYVQMAVYCNISKGGIRNISTFTSSAGVGIAVAICCGNNGSCTGFSSAENCGTGFSSSCTYSLETLLGTGTVNEHDTQFLNVSSDFKQLS